jgi:hypothetical protein
VRSKRKLLAAACSVVLAGSCALGATAAGANAYAKQMKAVGHELSPSLLSLSTATGISLHYPVQPNAAKRVVAILVATHAKLRDVATKLRAIAAPRAVAAEHTKLVTGIEQLAKELEPVIARERAGYLVAAAHLLELPAVEKVSLALAALAKHGYRVVAA